MKHSESILGLHSSVQTQSKLVLLIKFKTFGLSLYSINSLSNFKCYEKKSSSFILSDNLAVSIELLTLGKVRVREEGWVAQ